MLVYDKIVHLIGQTDIIIDKLWEDQRYKKIQYSDILIEIVVVILLDKISKEAYGTLLQDDSKDIYYTSENYDGSIDIDTSNYILNYFFEHLSKPRYSNN